MFGVNAFGRATISSSSPNRKVLSVFNTAYDTLHSAMSYDGKPSEEVSRAGISDADKLISWLENRMANQMA